MKNYKFFMKTLCVSVLGLSLNAATLSADPSPPSDIILSDANLTFLDSVSTLPLPSLECLGCLAEEPGSPLCPVACVPELFNSLSPFTQNGTLGAFYAPSYDQYFVGDLLLTSLSYKPQGGNPVLAAEAGYPAPYPDSFFPAFIIHNVSNGTLQETSRLNFNDNPPAGFPLPAGYGAANLLGTFDVAASPVASQPFIAVASFTPSACITDPTPYCQPGAAGCCIPSPIAGPQEYILYIYQYNPDGTIANDKQPVSQLNFADVNSRHGTVDTNYITYNSSVAFSHDGLYLFVTYTLNTPGPQGQPITQIFGAFAIGSNGQISTTPACEFVMPYPPQPEFSTGIYGVYFPQPDVRTFIPNRSSTYKVIAAFSCIDVNDVTGGDVPGSLLMSFDFNPQAGTIANTGIQALPSFLQSYDLNPATNDRVIVATQECSSTGKAVGQLPPAPFNYSGLTPPLPLPAPTNNVRLYSYNSNVTSNALTYLTGHNFGGAGFGFNARWSHGGDRVVMTFVPAVLTSGALPYDIGFGSGNIVTFDFNKVKSTLSIDDIQPTAGLPFNIAWSADDSMIATAGSPSLINTDIQLYSVGVVNKVAKKGPKAVATTPVKGNVRKVPAKTFENPVAGKMKARVAAKKAA